jgi:MFS family permease
LAFGGFLLLGGRVADRSGRRLVFVSGVVGFAAASLVCGLFPRDIRGMKTKTLSKKRATSYR